MSHDHTTKHRGRVGRCQAGLAFRLGELGPTRGERARGHPRLRHRLLARQLAGGGRSQQNGVRPERAPDGLGSLCGSGYPRVSASSGRSLASGAGRSLTGQSHLPALRRVPPAQAPSMRSPRRRARPPARAGHRRNACLLRRPARTAAVVAHTLRRARCEKLCKWGTL